MSFEKVPAGKSLPDDFYVVIEIPLNSSIKYEIDKDATLPTTVISPTPCVVMAMPLTYWYFSRNQYKQAQ